MRKMSKQETAAYRKQKIDGAMSMLEQGVREVVDGGEWGAMLSTMSKFHTYSWRNCLLIHQQMPGATMVAGYKDWQRKFKRNVRKGEKGIDILAPIIRKRDDDEENSSYMAGVRTVRVFDISQTEGEELPTVCHELAGEVDGYDRLISALAASAPCPVSFASVDGEAHGFYDHESRSITVDDGMSQEQTVKTLVHEIAHATLHAMPGKPSDLHGEELYEFVRSRGAREVQAESIAYIVSDWLGIDSSGYSFGYVAGWADGDMDKVKESLGIIRDGSRKIIDSLEDRLAESLKAA